MSGFFRPRNLMIAGGVAAGLLLFPRTMAKHNPVGNPFETSAVKSVGDRMSAGGGSTTHTPAVATPRGAGKSDATISQQSTFSGPGSPAHEEKLEQRPGEPGALSKAYRQAHYGNDKGK